MYPNLYKKSVIQYDKFSQMFHNKINNKNSRLINNSNERINLAKGLESFKYNIESNVEPQNPSNIFEMMNRNRFNQYNKISEEKRCCNLTNIDYSTNFGFFKNSKKKKNFINPQENKFYYKKKFVIKRNENEEDDIVSNFNPKHNRFYNHLLGTNSFTEIHKIKENKEKISEINVLEKPINRNSIDCLDDNMPYENLKKDKETLRLSIKTEKSNGKSLKNRFYYSLKGKMRKQTQANLIPANFTALNYDDTYLHETGGLFGNSKNNSNTMNNINKVNKKEIVNQEVNFNNSQISMKIYDSKIINSKPTKDESSKDINLQLEKINSERESINNNSPKIVKDIVLNNMIEKEYAHVEKKNNPIRNLIFNNNKEMNENDFYRNFNIFNMNNLNLSHVKLKKNFFNKSPENNNLKQEKIHLFPKSQAKSNPNKELVIDGVYNVVELKTSLKKKKNKFIITNSHFLV